MEYDGTWQFDEYVLNQLSLIREEIYINKFKVLQMKKI